MTSFDHVQPVVGDMTLAHAEAFGDLWVRVALPDWANAARACRDELSMTYFSFLSAMDWQPNPNLDGTRTFDASRQPVPVPDVISDEAIRMTGGQTRFQLIGRVADIRLGMAVTLVADAGNVDDELTAPSWTAVYPGADWHERETWEMFGISFTGHPGLRHIYLPEGFEGHPLRKDYALLSRVVRPWPGLVDMEEMPPVEQPDETGARNADGGDGGANDGTGE